MKLMLHQTDTDRLYANAMDNFIYNSMIKTGTGYALGLMISFAFFKRKMFPMYIGTGIGVGFAISDYLKEIRSIRNELKSASRH